MSLLDRKYMMLKNGKINNMKMIIESASRAGILCGLDTDPVQRRFKYFFYDLSS